MKPPCSSSCLLMLSFSACFCPGHAPHRYPGKELAATEEEPTFWTVHIPKWRRSAEDLHALFSIAKELQGFGTERAGICFRLGRDQEGHGDEHEAIHYPLEKGGVKRRDALGTLAEELNSYNRKKGGFSFCFGRRVTQR